MIQTERLTLVPNTVEDARALVEGLDPAQRAEVSPIWLTMLESPSVDAWMLGYRIVNRASGEKIGTCGFKGPPGDNATVEIAYGVDPAQRVLTKCGFQSVGAVMDPEDGWFGDGKDDIGTQNSAASRGPIPRATRVAEAAARLC